MLTQNLPPATVGSIVTQARARNAQHSITGLLVFDGMRFCQHLEGPQRAVETLMERIRAGSQAHEREGCLSRAPGSPPLSSGLGMGLAESEGPDLMAGVHALEGEAALKHFLALQPSFDINA